MSQDTAWDTTNIARSDPDDKRIYGWRSSRVLGRLIKSGVKPVIDGLSGLAFAWFVVVAIVWRRPLVPGAVALDRPD